MSPTCFILLGLVASFGFPPPAAEVFAEQRGPRSEVRGQRKAAATLRVLIHEKAKLTVDDAETKSTGPERIFTTPELTLGQTYSYTLKWSYNDGGVNVTRMAVIQFEPGKEKLLDLRPGKKAVPSSSIIYVPTDQPIVNRMLKMAKVKKDDIVYDLGCGDGRIIVTAAKKYGARGIGIDIDPARIKDSQENIKKNKVENLVEVRQGDALQVPDISRATVVMLYMLPEFQEKLAPILKRELKPGTRVVAHDYWLPGWDALDTVEIPGMFRDHTLYLYQVGGAPEKKQP